MSHLTIEEREVIARLHCQKVSQKEIAQELGRSPSTICRELQRNKKARRDYGSHLTQQQACQRRANRPLTRRMENPELLAKVSRTHRVPCDEQDDDMAQEKTVFATERFPTVFRFPKDPNAWRLESELDLVVGTNHSGYLITAVDRRSGYMRIRKVTNKQSRTVMRGICEMFKDEDRSLLKTFTFDNGTEFTRHAILAKELGVKVYFADPYNSGQRGTNENTNGLVRQ